MEILNKPLLSSKELVESMEKRGIKFSILKKEEAIDYFLNKNNYFRTACYRKNFNKAINKDGKSVYMHLDFFHLTELSTLDMRYRYIIYQMCLDIEHSLKVALIKYFETNSKDAYSPVQEFLNTREYVKSNITRMKNKSYPNNLINKYFTFQDNEIKNINCPVWAFVEILTFGDFIDFYYFCQTKFENNIHHSKFLKNTAQIYLVKNLRNACAHNNCIFENLRTGQSKPPTLINIAVSKFSDISSNNRKKKLTVRPILEFTALLLIYKDLVSESITICRISELKHLFFKRMVQNVDIFKKNDILVSNYEFTTKIINNIF